MKIIIIGASTGIGKEMALLWAAKGNLVGITGRRNDLLNEVKQHYSSNIITSCFDVTQKDCISSIEALIKEMSGLDLLLYNAGFGEPSKDLNTETEKAITKLNVTGFVEVVSYAFNYFSNQGYGQIAVTSSIAALRGNSWSPAYSASKAFVSNYAEGLNIKAKRLKKDITVTDIKPGFVRTEMAKGQGLFWVSSPQKAARQMVSAIESKRRVAYITKRWWLVAQVMKLLPYAIYRRIA